MRGFRQTILLAAVLFILGGVLWWLAFTQEEALEKNAVYRLPAAKITSIEVTHTPAEAGEGEFDHYLLELAADGKWTMTAPVTDEIDGDIVERMLEVLTKLTVESQMAEVSDYAQYGLEQPALRVKAGLKDGKTRELWIGDETPVSFKFYARFAAEPEVFVISGTDRGALNHRAKEVRSKKVLPVDANEVTGVKLRTSAGKSYTLVKENDEWRLQAPFAERLAHHMVMDLLVKLNELRAEDFLDDLLEPARYGLETPDFTLDLTLAGGEQVTLKAGRTADASYLTHNRRACLLRLEEDESLDFLDLKLADYINKNLNSLDKHEAHSVILRERGGPELTVEEEYLGDVWWGYLGSFFLTEPHYQKDENTPTPRSAFADHDPLWEVVIKVKEEEKRDQGKTGEATGGVEDVHLKVYPFTTDETYLITSSQRAYVYKIGRETVDDLIERIKETVELQEKEAKNKE
jgi:hypothetical protein